MRAPGRVAAFVLACALLGPALPVRAGEFDSVSDATLERLATDIQALADQRALNETLKAQLATQQQQITALLKALTELKDAEQKRAIAVAIAEDRDQRRQETEAQLRNLLDRHEKLLEKALARVDSLEARQSWLMIGGVLALLAGLALGAL